MNQNPLILARSYTYNYVWVATIKFVHDLILKQECDKGANLTFHKGAYI